MNRSLVQDARPRVLEGRVAPCRLVEVGDGDARESVDARAARALRLGEVALVARLRAGDDAAFATLVRAYGPRMLAVARRYLPSPEDAEDVLQSAFLLVFRFVQRFEGAAQLSTWLHRIVVNCALMRIRTRQRHPEARLDLSAFEDGAVPGTAAREDADVSKDVVTRESLERLTRAVGRLPDLFRAAVRLHDLDGLTLAETSRILGRSRASIETSVHRGRVALRSMLAPEERAPRG